MMSHWDIYHHVVELGESIKRFLWWTGSCKVGANRSQLECRRGGNHCLLEAFREPEMRANLPFAPFSGAFSKFALSRIIYSTLVMMQQHFHLDNHSSETLLLSLKTNIFEKFVFHFSKKSDIFDRSGRYHNL